jgi:hypothetical protein
MSYQQVGNQQVHRRILWAARISLVIALAVTVAFPNWEQFKGKGMALRVPFYLLPAIVVPIVWWLRKKRAPYPYLVDALVIAPFLADTLGNVFGFYLRFDATDDVLHFLNWILLMGGITLAILRTNVNRLTAWALGWGLGALAIIWWEAAEWLVQELGTNGLQLTYGDTIGDLILSSTGGAVGSAIAVFSTRGRPTTGRSTTGRRSP